MSKNTVPQVEAPKSVWIFDSNYRVYKKDADGNCFGGPIWRSHWREKKIVGET